MACDGDYSLTGGSVFFYTGVTGTLPGWSTLTKLVYMLVSMILLDSERGHLAMKIAIRWPLTHQLPTETWIPTISMEPCQLGQPSRICHTCEYLVLALRDTALKGKSATRMGHLFIFPCRFLDYNQISGTLPEWSTLTNLEYMWVFVRAHNQKWLPSSTSSPITFSYLSSNRRIGGTLPGWTSLTKLTNM